MMNDLNYKELLENLMHELSGVGSIIKASAEALSKASKGSFDKQAFSHHSDVILENAFLLSTHLDIINYQLNPDFIEIERPAKRNLYGKFFKAKLSYLKLAKQRDLNIDMTGEATTFIDSYPVIDTLPILIFDNAIKYSPKSTDIEIEFDETDNSIEVCCSNMGPYISPEEKIKIFERGYRAKEAIKTNIQGHGYGLSFVKYICDIHHAKVEVFSKNNPIKIGDINYDEFTIKLTFPKNALT